jgi:hypothetical protein
MATQVNGTDSFLANSSISAFRAVAISSNRGVGLNPNSAVPMGFTQQDVASGSFVQVKFFFGPGSQKCSVTATPITIGNTLYAGADGRLSVTGTVTVGRALQNASANGAVISIEPVVKIA